MLGSYVCRQCRTRLTRRIHPVRAPSWQPRATIVSFRNSNPQTRPTDTPPDEQPQEDSEPPISSNHDYGPSPSQPPRGSGRYSRLVDDAVGAEPARTPRFTISRGEHGVAFELVGLTRRSGNADEAWQHFEAHYTSKECDALANPTTGDVAILKDGEVFNEILRKVTASFCHATDRPTTTPTMALFKYEQLGLATQNHWKWQTLLYLTHAAMVAINAPPGLSQGDLPSILTELLSVWRLLFQCKGKGAQLDYIRADWNLPTPENLPSMHDSKAFSWRLQNYLPGDKVDHSLTFCAVYLYTISDAFGANESLQREAEPFIEFLTRLLAGSHVSAAIDYALRESNSKFRSLPDDVQKEIIRELDSAPLKALAAVGSSPEHDFPSEGVQTEHIRKLDNAPSRASKTPRGHDMVQEPGFEGNSTANLEAFHLSRIERAVETERSPMRLETLWKETIRAFTAEGKVAVPRRVYNAFLSGYIILNRAPRAVEVWNHMIVHGVNPDIQSWVALLHGCERSKDLEAFNTMWIRLLNSGTELDTHAWTTRVHGLFYLREINLGLAALDDMGKRWLTAEQSIRQPQPNSRNQQSIKKLTASAKAINKHVKPSIEVINGAITALVRSTDRRLSHQKRVEHVQKLLAWAGDFSIKPDAVTYNALIQLYIRASEHSTAFKILRQMEREGIEADVATHTMLINSSFDNGAFDGLSHAQQTEKIISMLDGLKAAGLKLNDYIYSAAIDRLLKNYSNFTAVRQLTEHMKAHKLVPSKYVYTSLITHYFQQDPPEIAAVDTLVNQIFTAHRIIADHVLLDRTLEGYAAADEIGKMMSVLTRMSKQGRQPGWYALTAVIQALVRDGDYDRARSIVRDVRFGDKAERWGLQGGSDQENRFFYQAKILGVFDDDGPANKMPGFGSGSSSSEFTMSKKAIRSSRDEKPLREQPRQQEIEQRTREEKVQDGLEELTRASQSAAEKQQNEDVLQEEVQGELEQPASDSRPAARDQQEEDIHDFLRDDHEDIHSRVNKQ